MRNHDREHDGDLLEVFTDFIIIVGLGSSVLLGMLVLAAWLTGYLP